MLPKHELFIKLQNTKTSQTSSVAKIGKCRQFHNWQILWTPKLPKLKFEHTCLVYPGIQTAQFTT